MATVSIELLAREVDQIIGFHNLESVRLAGGITVTGLHPSAQALVALQSRTLVQLKDVRSRVVILERSTQDAAKVATAKAASRDHLMLQVLDGKKAAGSARANAKRSISNQKAEVVNVQRRIKTGIDDVIRQVTTSRAGLKVEMASYGRSYRANRVAATPSSPPGWHADPSARFQYRYWDGVKWTTHVSTGGVASMDSQPLL